MDDPYREEEEASFRSFLPVLKQLLQVCGESVQQAIDSEDYELARRIVDRVVDTLASLVAQRDKLRTDR